MQRPVGEAEQEIRRRLIEHEKVLRMIDTIGARGFDTLQAALKQSKLNFSTPETLEELKLFVEDRVAFKNAMKALSKDLKQYGL